VIVEWEKPIPGGLEPGMYNTAILKAGFREGQLYFKLRFLGTKYDRSSSQCLLPVTLGEDYEADAG
jgi:hypothetical protein